MQTGIVAGPLQFAGESYEFYVFDFAGGVFAASRQGGDERAFLRPTGFGPSHEESVQRFALGREANVFVGEGLALAFVELGILSGAGGSGDLAGDFPRARGEDGF